MDLDSELQKRYNVLEKAARKAAKFKSYSKHSIFCVEETVDSCDCGLADLRAALGENEYGKAR